MDKVILTVEFSFEVAPPVARDVAFAQAGVALQKILDRSDDDFDDDPADWRVVDGRYVADGLTIPRKVIAPPIESRLCGTRPPHPKHIYFFAPTELALAAAYECPGTEVPE